MYRKLFTPGPLTTTPSVRAAMNEDWGTRDKEFISLTRRVRDRLCGILNGSESHEAVLIQGSGTFAIEATIATLVGPNDHLLVLINGEYGKRIAAIAERHSKNFSVLEFGDTVPICLESVSDYLRVNSDVTHVALVQLETTTGIMNPYKELARVTNSFGCSLILDAMSGFGCYSIDVQSLPCAAVIASSNKCLHSVPGIGFCVIDRKIIRECRGNAASLSLDLYDQWAGFETNGQWRFTPPTNCLAALNQAIDEFESEGSEEGRLRRYDSNATIVVERLLALGFKCIISPEHRSSVILTFECPPDGWFDFDRLYSKLAAEGIFLYPGKLTQQDSFRIGCIGALDRDDFESMLTTFERAVKELRQSTG